MQSFITINGTKFPQPRRGLELLSATIVDSARNANDRTATPYHLDLNTGLPADYINCKVNIIDCGEPF